MKRGTFFLALIIIGFLVWGTSSAWGSWQYAESEAETTTTSTVYLTKVQELAPSGGDYLILASWELGINDTAAFALARVVHNTTTISDLSLQTFDGTNRYRTFAFHSILSLAAGDSIKIAYATNNALYSARIKRARILMVPLTGMEYATGTGLNVMNLGTGWSSASSTAITPATEGDYLVVASVDTRPNSTVASGECRVDLDGSSTWDLLTMEGKSVSDRVPYFSARVMHLSASAHTLRLQARSDEGTTTDIYSPRITVIRLSQKFNDFGQGEQPAADSTTNGADNWVNRLNQVHHPFQPGRYLVLGSSFVKSLPDTSVIPEQRWTAGGQEENKFLGIMKDSTDFLPLVGFKVLNWNSAPETLQVDYGKYSSGSQWVHIRDARLLAISEQLWTGFPVLDSIGPKGLVEGDTLKLRIHAKDPDADPITLSAINVPSNAVFIDSGNGAGALVFAPAFNQAGSYNITFIAQDNTAKADTQVIVIPVAEFGNNLPVLDSIGPQSLAEGDTLRLRIHATDPDLDPLTLTITGTPTNAVFVDSGNGSGSLVFTPDFNQAGIYPVTFIVADTAGGADSELVQITVNNVNRTPVLEAIGPKSVNEGSSLSFRISASDPDGDPLTLNAINTPLNATFVDSGNGAGSLVFNPDYTQAGIYPVTFIVADTFLAADSEIVRITVNNVNRDPVLDPIGPQSLTEGDTLRLRVHATDPDLDSLILSAVNIPANAVFVDSGNGLGSLVFPPNFTQSGIYNVTFRSIDPLGGADSEVVQITVAEFGNHAPVLEEIGPKSIVEGDTLRFRIHAADLDEEPLVLTATNVPVHAGFVDSGNGSGSFVFAPDFTQSGIYNVTFKSSDPLGAVDSEVVQITVTEWGNHAPELAAIGARSVSEGDTLRFGIHATDPDVDSIILTASDIPTNATLVDSGNGSGSFVFTPDFSQSGIYNVTLRASDTLGGVDSEIVQITVNNTNRPPVLASIGSQIVDEAQVLQFRISGTDPDGDSLHFSAVDVPINATLVDSGNGAGSFTFNPSYDQSGVYNVIFITSDGSMADSEIVQITVNNINRAPMLSSIGAKGVNEGQTLEFRISANDPDGNLVTLSAVDVPPNASFADSGNGAGSFTFNPDYNQAGVYHVTFITSDGSLADSEIVDITVNNTNRAPMLASIGSKTVDEAQTLQFRISGTDPDGDSVHFNALDVPTNATFTDSGNGAGSLVFNPDFNQAGVYNVTFIALDGSLADSEIVQITVNNTNRPPVLASIGSQIVDEAQTLQFRISGTDPDGDSLHFSGVDIPLNATLVDSGNGAGSFTFNPSYDQAGIYHVTFITSDGGLADSEIVQITVNNVNRAPALSSIGAKGVDEGQTLEFRVSAVDPDGDPITLSAVDVPANASFADSGNGAGSFTFNPSYDQSGVYNVTFITSDGSLADSEIVAITVNHVNRPPVLAAIGPKTMNEAQVLQFRISGTDPDGDSVHFSALDVPTNATFTDSGNGAGSFTFNPDYNQAGIYPVTFIATDRNLADSELVSITVNNVNRAPDLAAIGPRSVIEGGHLGFLVTASDPDNDPLVLTARNLPNHSSFTDSGNGKGSFTLDPDYTQSGTYYVTFKAADLSLADSEIVQITVIDAGNQAPVLDSIGPKTIAEAETLSFRIHATDPDGNNPALYLRNNPANSTFVDSGNGSGSFKFIPNYQQAGVYLVSFVTTDGVLQDSERVQITVTNTDRPPVLEAIGPKSVNEGDSLVFRMHATDPDNDSVALTVVSLPSNATFADSGNGAGSFKFKPGYAQSGIYSVTFIASAGALADSEAVQITVNDVGNQAPVLNAIGPKTVIEGNHLEFRISATDVDLDPIVLSALDVPLNATFTDSGNGSGSFAFDPGITQAGIYNVTFIASDGPAADSETVQITVSDAGNRAPILEPIGAKAVMEGSTLQFRIYAIDLDLDSIILQAVNIPLNSSFVDSGNGAGSFVFNPSFAQAGTYYVTFRALDTLGGLDSEVVEISVGEFGNRAPVLEAIGPQSLLEGGTLSLRISAQDPDLDPIVLSALDVPANGTLIDSGNGAGSFIFTPDFAQSGIYTVTFIASDGFLADSERVEITVIETGNHAPVLDSIGPKSVLEGGSLEFRIHANDVDKDPLFLQAVNLPRNATFVDSGNGSGLFAINPDYAQSGIYPVTFVVNDTSGAADSEVVDISVIETGNHAPVLASIGPKSVAEKNTLTFGLHATDLDMDNIVLSALNLPTHATLVDSGNGAGSFTFTPDSSQSGIYQVTYIASDASLADSEVVDITVTEWANHAPVLDSIGPKTIHEGDSLVFSVTASDSDGTVPVLAVSNLPEHATFVDNHNGHGLFRFYSTFYQAGVDTVTFEAIDMSNPPPLSDMERVVITILDVNQPPAIDTIGPKTIQAGQILRFRVVGRDSTDPDGGLLHMSAVDLPLNATYHDSGGGVGGFVFAPDYSQAEVDTVTFFCTDEGTPPLSGFRKVEITVTQGADRAPVLDVIGFKMVTEGTTLSFRVHATDPDGTTPILYTSLPLPQNASFVDSANGAGSFLFTPSFVQAGLYQITFYAGDGQLNDYEQVMIQVVEAGNQAPVLDSIGPKSVLEGDSLKFRVHAVDPEGNPVTLSIRNNPANSSLADSGNGSGTFLFKPNYTQSGIYTVTFRAADSFGKPDSELVQITVIEAGNQPPVLDSIGPKVVTERQWLNFAVTASDPEGNTPTLRAFGLPPTASFTDNHNGTGSFVYRPTLYEQGIYDTRFEAVDSVDTLLRDWEMVQITVLDSNQFPAVTVQPDSIIFAVNEGGTCRFRIVGTDPDSTIPIPGIRPLITNTTLVDSGNGVGLFTFRPGYNQGGYPAPKIYEETVFVVDQFHPGDTTWLLQPRLIRVYDVPEPPNIVPINDTTIVEGQALDIHVATTSTVDIPTLQATGLPVNATFADSGNGKGRFHFAPDFTQDSVYLVRFISRSRGLADTESVNITVTEFGNHAPVLDSVRTRTVGEGSTLSIRLHATDLDMDPITLLAYNVPTNAVFVDSGNGSGSFVFHPDWQQAGVYNVTFIARDIFAAQDSEVVRIIVEHVNQTPVLDPIGPKTIPEGSTLSFRVHGTDVDSDTLLLTAAPLPAHTVFHDSGNGAGVFTFTPNYYQSGTYNVVFQISDRNSSDMEIVSITVTNVPQPPDLDSIGPKTVNEGDSLKFRIHAADPDGDPVTLSIRDNPTNSSLVDSGNGSGTFRFKPSFVQAGVYLVTFKAADNTGRADSEMVQITVNDAGNQRPDILLPLPDSTEPTVGDTFRIRVYAIDTDGPSLVLSVSGLPNRATFVDSGNGGGLFKFRPDSIQADSVYRPIFIASDGFLADSVKVIMHVVSFIRGDANADGKVELGDLVYLINYLYRNGPAPVPLLRGDANCDNLVNLGDIVLIINYLFRSGPAPGCPPKGQAAGDMIDRIEESYR